MHAYRKRADHLKAFIRDSVIQEDRAETASSHAYQAYTDWCATYHEPPLGTAQPKCQLEDLGHEHARTKSRQCVALDPVAAVMAMVPAMVAAAVAAITILTWLAAATIKSNIKLAATAATKGAVRVRPFPVPLSDRIRTKTPAKVYTRSIRIRSSEPAIRTRNT